MSEPSEFDAIVVGGGPAGAAAALRLAQHGLRAVVIDKTTESRFHIGESLIPYVLKILDELGVFERVANDKRPDGQPTFTRKNGIETIAEDGSFRKISFRLVADGIFDHAFNVEREHFDRLLLETARERGVDVRRGCTVKEFVFEGQRAEGVRYTDENGTEHVLRASHVVDASGRAGLLSTRVFHSRVFNKRLKNLAIYQHYLGVKMEDLPGHCDWGDVVLGNTGPKGWLWGIQVSPEVLSVGAVVPHKAVQDDSPAKVLQQWIDAVPRIAARIRSAKVAWPEPKVESDFCYHSEKLAGPGWFMVGDAGCFVDPLFSGGVCLAMATGLRAADTIRDIKQGRDEAEAYSRFERFAKTGYDAYFRLLYSLHDCADGSLLRYFEPPPPFGSGYPALPPFKIQVASGDFWGDEDHPMLSTLRANKEWATFEPFEPLYGEPFYPKEAFSTRNMPGPATFKKVLDGGIRTFDTGGNEVEAAFISKLKNFLRMTMGG